ncbi:MAG: hypothetical protein DDT27_01461 [Dehalococcoidia bacterium]|nr:hypothetical protein [Chloroflexota bacterium]MBT9161302.1 hypothetical protein [Chloroflexota bacterium]MBT9162896.1 hypothetical protein [Chloroflexota bacterium]
MLITLTKDLRSWKFLQRIWPCGLASKVIVFHKEMPIGRIDKGNMVQAAIFLSLLKTFIRRVGTSFSFNQGNSNRLSADVDPHP